MKYKIDMGFFVNHSNLIMTVTRLKSLTSHLVESLTN